MSEVKQSSNPSVIARDALRRLAARNLAPTPANYQECYNEIALLPNVAPFPEPPLRQLAAALIARTPEQSAQLVKLNAAIGRRSWQGVQEVLVALVNQRGTGNPHNGSAIVVPVDCSSLCLPPGFMGQVASTFEGMLPALADDAVELPAQLGELLRALRQPTADMAAVQQLLGSVSHRLSFAAEEQVEVKHALLRLLRLIIDNIGQLCLDDAWLKGQAEALHHAAEPPITLRRLDDVECRLKDVLFKQAEARSRSIEVQEEIRRLLAGFVGRISEINESSHAFQGTLEDSVQEIADATRIEDLAPLLKRVIVATRTMAEDTARTREDFSELQQKVQATQAELDYLHSQLDSASAMARHDPLTDALNRKGLDEALAREIASVRRKEAPLSICLLDIDNFKKLNDRLGHHAGDAALVHLAEVTRACLRSQDTLARYGGEEFVILMPDTPLEQGIEAMKRLQRELTKSFFLAGKEHVLITFSAGVAELTAEESGDDAIRRADEAMYLAKRAGKNRVLSC